MPESVVRVEGLQELTRAFRVMDEAVSEDLIWSLEEAANPVKLRAQSLAYSGIRNLAAGSPYGAFRIGVSKAQGLVYMVPAWRTYGRRPRPNFGGLLMSRAMEPALASEQENVVRKVEKFIDEIADRQGF